MDARDAARAVDDFARWLRGCQSRVVTDTGLQLQCSLPYTEEVMREWFRITLDAYARELGRKALAK